MISPVVSLVVNNKEMFDPRTGMYVMGPRAQENYPNWGANFGRIENWNPNLNISIY